MKSIPDIYFRKVEYYQVITEEGEPTGLISSRDHIHTAGLWHETVHVWIKFGQKLLLQKRGLFKDTNPGLWDISSAGHIDAGEEITSAAIREVYEELGLCYTGNDLKFLFKVKHQFHNEAVQDNEWSHVFLIEEHWDPPIIPNIEEVEDVCFLTPSEFQNKLEIEPHTFVDHKEELERLFDHLQSQG